MKRLWALGLVVGGVALAQTDRLYTAPAAGARGGIVGQLPVGELTHVLAVDQERQKVFRGTSGRGAGHFQFEGLPVGKYDVVVVTQDGRVWEGLRLGAPAEALPATVRENLEKRIALADSFFNRYKIQRVGVAGERALVLVERVRDRTILKQSGEKLDANLRRLEVLELARAEDDWQVIRSRHLYREAESNARAPVFWRPGFVPELGGIRVVESVKDIGAVPAPKE